uniref:Calcium-transporting ATPase 12, plasma membrane-type-like n=1 Tax=Nicotiana tabacum TaxID=4097 RepID=A0A1S4D4Y0_TOBAC|nr:PREDICTED: calcium-transporting ATPase 12, plasma membrane-type-like [Nicotiana tabacum]
MRRSALIVRSAQMFIEAGAKIASLSRVTSSSTINIYAPLNSFNLQQYGELEASGDQIQLDEVVAASPDGAWHVNIVQSDNDHIEIELQPHQHCLQISKINEIVKEKNMDSLHNFGGVKGVVEALSSDVEKGIHVGDISRRKGIDLSHHMTFTEYGHFFLQLARKEPTILLLAVAAILSFAFGINEEGMQNGWFEGALLLVIIFVTVLIKIARIWYQRRCWKKQNDHKANAIQVMRGGKEVAISASDIVYGDIAFVKKGHSVPAHGLFVSGEALELFQLDDGILSIVNEKSPFLPPGSKVINGDARMIVTSVQVDKPSQENKISETESNFCAYFDKLSNCIHIGGLLISILIILVVFLRFKLGKKDDENGYRLETKGEPAELASIVNAMKKVLTETKETARVWIALLGVTMLGMTEGIPFLVSIAIAYWNLDVKMEPVTTICIEKASWLKEQKLEVTQFFLGKKDVTEIPPHVCSVLSDGIVVSTLTSQRAYHRIEEPILCWAEKNTGMQRETFDQQCTIVNDNDIEMNPLEEPCGVVIEKNGDNGKEYYSHFKGPAESILSKCSSYYDLEGQVQPLDDERKSDFARVNNNVNVVAFACKRTQVAELDENGLTFIGMLVLEDSTINLDNMKQAIATLKKGGVKTIFASEEDVEVLDTIGHDTGLLNSHDALVVKGEDFYNFTADDRKEKVEKIFIMGNSSPAHKLLLIECLKRKGEVVVVVGEQVAGECNQLVLEAANFGLPVVTNVMNWPEIITFVINRIKGGRIVCENLRQWIQLELILAISSSSINFILVICNRDAPLTTIQLVWVNLLVTFIGGPALLITQQTTRKLRDELSIKPRKPLVTKVVWRNILFQASYQTGIFVYLQHRGSAILYITPKVTKSVVFNGFALCQIFNMFSAREVEQKNFFKGLGQNYWFWAVSGLFLVLQVGFIEVEPLFSNTARLNWEQWGGCILIGAVTWLFDWIVKWVSEYIKIDKCDCGVLHLARKCISNIDFKYCFNRISCCLIIL